VAGAGAQLNAVAFHSRFSLGEASIWLRPPRAPRNLTPPSNVGSGNRSDKPTWRCQQIPLIGALGIQVICYPRRAFQERLINDRKERMINPWKLARAGIRQDYLNGERSVERVGDARAPPPSYLPQTLTSFSFCLIGKRMRLEGMNTRH